MTLSIQRKLSKILDTAANSTEISRKSFQKIRELLNFRSANYEPKLLEIPGAKLNGKKTPGKIFQKLLGMPREVVPVLDILKKAVLFTTGSCRKFKPEVQVEWKATNMLTRLSPASSRFSGKFSFLPIVEHCILGGHLYIFNFSVSGPIRK